MGKRLGNANKRLSVYKRGVRGIVFLAFALLPLTVSAQSIRGSSSGTSGQNVPLWVAHEAGLFKKQGLKDELILISGGSTNMQAMLAAGT